MSISTTKKVLGAIAAAGLLVSLSACGQAPESTPSDKPSASESVAPSGPASDVVEGFKPCMVSDEGGFDDKSFNQLGFEGLKAAAAELGVDYKETESKNENDYKNNLDGLVAEGCTFIVSVGFKLSQPTIDSALANPDIQYAIIDDWADNDGKSGTDAPNIKPLVFDTSQAAFLGGYAAAAQSKTGKVGTFGGAKIPPVTIFMDGFELGVKYFNEKKGKDVKVLGWDMAKQDGQFTNEFAANDKAKQVAQSLIDQDADVLLPVGGPIYQSAAQAIRDAKSDIALLGVDADVYETDPSVKDLLLLSIEKGMDVAVHEAVVEAGKGNFDPTPFVGVLENDGVGISGFHDYESKVDPGLKAELDEIRQGIISGSIDATSPSSPKSK